MSQRGLGRAVRSVLFHPIPVVRPICTWESRAARLIATAVILYVALLPTRMLHPALPRYFFLFLFSGTLVSLTLRTLWRLWFRRRSLRPVRHSLSLLAELLRQPWPALAAAMLIIGLLTPLVVRVPLPDALFAGQATAILVPLTRLEMRPEVTRLLH